MNSEISSQQFDPGLRPALIARIEATLVRRQLSTDYELFARERLKIRAKSGKTVPLEFNRAQQYLHARLEEQRTSTGKVRALILKGRQQGCSTYVGGRFYHRVIHNQGLRVFILTHEDPATQNLFEMAYRFQDNMPGDERPAIGTANANELLFTAIDGGYKVGTARTKGAGRSSTIQLFHGSEVGFWPNAESHAAGALQAVPDAPGTEIVLESTANGIGNYYHQKWRDAEKGLSEYIAVFIPWFWQEEYRSPIPEGFACSLDELEYKQLYGLDDQQIAWRRNKISDLKDPNLFKQEYPATAAEAFQMSGHDSYIPPALIAQARKATFDGNGPLVIGYDPNWKGDDRASMAWRRGRKIEKVESRNKLDTMQQAGWLKSVIDKDKPKRVFIDVGGVGAGVYDRLNEMGFGAIVRPINFGSSPFEPQPVDADGKPQGGPANRRAEMWMKSKEWLEDPAGVNIPDTDTIQADACGPAYSYDSSSRLILESKDHMRSRGVASPDEWDAVALTFAEPVAPDAGFSRKLEYAKQGYA
jgi:hypothetical protein